MLKHSVSLHTVSQKHHFFDSGLLYQFCINFRRRRRLSELLHETESEEQECTTQQNQDDQADSPFTLRITPPPEGNSNFSSSNKTTTPTKITLKITLILVLWYEFYIKVWRLYCTSILRKVHFCGVIDYRGFEKFRDAEANTSAHFTQNDFQHTNCGDSPSGAIQV